MLHREQYNGLNLINTLFFTRTTIVISLEPFVFSRDRKVIWKLRMLQNKKRTRVNFCKNTLRQLDKANYIITRMKEIRLHYIFEYFTHMRHQKTMPSSQRVGVWLITSHYFYFVEIKFKIQQPWSQLLS